MLANLGLESESRGGECRHHGRRHALRNEVLDHQPPYLRAPFAVQQEPLKNSHLSAMPEVQEIFMEEENNIGSPATACHASQPQLEAERLTKGGLNIFSWNTDAPVIPPSRVRRERDVEELLRLRPLDPELKRDLEVREKFEGNKQSHFLCFGENEETGKHLGARRANDGTPSLVPPGPALVPNGFSGNPGRAGGAVLHGRRRVAPRASTDEGIAGFAGMGMGSGKRPCNPVKNNPVGF
ncbi:hypothetical protein TraAM80_08185 [Trypanosoma rangeli]|uniref:Uncharacterized protein n=1 Tax=Trypanosoma rangeli TaxID=5698 RepID=A0A3R7JZY0_TRYRA|nr:uncharacterized protein TraAM80_08185 [Trypanosoma rangeli]RNE99520.1 hypothetical protein TraAM80_08185 [Trypanosoma rangeli]|eukprot:RNE99520.1 hypothetical protein TraAM80_08185 [Trypanosoma rangeli]